MTLWKHEENRMKPFLLSVLSFISVSARLKTYTLFSNRHFLHLDYDPRRQATKNCARQPSVSQRCIHPHSRLMAIKDLAKAITTSTQSTSRVSIRAISIETVMRALREQVKEESSQMLTAPSMDAFRNLERSSIRAKKQISCHHSQQDLRVEQWASTLEVEILSIKTLVSEVCRLTSFCTPTSSSTWRKTSM